MRTISTAPRAAATALALATALTTAAGAAQAAPAKPKPAPPAVATATCTSPNPVGLITHDMVHWTITALVLRPGVVTLAGTGTVGQQDVIIRQFGSTAQVSWNNTTSGKFGTTVIRGAGPLPTLDETNIFTGRGAVTFNLVIKVGAGATWIAPQTSTPCVGTIIA